jgi:hypothetical protein
MSDPYHHLNACFVGYCFGTRATAKVKGFHTSHHHRSRPYYDYTPCLAKQRAQHRNGSKEDHEEDGHIEDQPLYAAPCLEDGAAAIAAECASQSGPAYLEQDKEDNDDAQYDLNDANCWKPLCSQIFPPLFYFTW